MTVARVPAVKLSSDADPAAATAADAPAAPTPHLVDDAPPSHRIARVLLALGIIALAAWISASFLRAVLWGGIIAIAIAPLYQRLEAWWPKGRRAALPALVTLLVAVLVIAPLTLAVVEAAHEGRQLAGWLTTARSQGIPLPAVVDHLPGREAIAGWWSTTLATPDAAAGTLDKANVVVMRHTRLFGADLMRRTVIFAFSLLTLFFLLRDRVEVAAQARRAGEKLFGIAGEQVAELILLSVRGTINGLVLVGVGEGVVMSLLYIVAKVPHPLLFGVLTGVAAAIPMGAAVMITVAALVLAGTGSTVAAIVVAAVGLAFVLVVDHTLRPALIGSATRIPFFLVLVGILGGVETLGLLGLFIGPAVMAVLVMLWREFVSVDPDARPGPSGRSPTTRASRRSRSSQSRRASS